MIPKILHYCWFGGAALPELEKRCIASWLSVMPDWEVMRWDESNFDVGSCEFSRGAYEAQKWAFVSDYARYRILAENGGIFLDADVELLKSLDEFRLCPGFVGFMKNNEFVAPGLVIGAEAGNEVVLKAMHQYEQMEFELRCGRNSMDTSPRVLTKLLESDYELRRDGTQQDLEHFIVFPSTYFDPLDSHSGKIEVTSDTYSIHHYSGTWLSPAKKYRIETRKKLAPRVGPKLSWLISSGMSVIKYGREAL